MIEIGLAERSGDRVGAAPTMDEPFALPCAKFLRLVLTSAPSLGLLQPQSFGDGGIERTRAPEPLDGGGEVEIFDTLDEADDVATVGADGTDPDPFIWLHLEARRPLPAAADRTGTDE